MDAGLEGWIESFNTISSQEEDTLEIFKESKEDADEGIPANILGLASLCTHSLAELLYGYPRAIPRKTSASSSNKTAPQE